VSVFSQVFKVDIIKVFVDRSLYCSLSKSFKYFRHLKDEEILIMYANILLRNYFYSGILENVDYEVMRSKSSCFNTSIEFQIRTLLLWFDRIDQDDIIFLWFEGPDMVFVIISCNLAPFSWWEHKILFLPWIIIWKISTCSYVLLPALNLHILNYKLILLVMSWTGSCHWEAWIYMHL
jgi:hypothetical protein